MARNKLIKFLRNTHDKFMSFLIYWGWEYRIKKRKLKRKYYPLTREQKKRLDLIGKDLVNVFHRIGRVISAHF